MCWRYINFYLRRKTQISIYLHITQFSFPWTSKMRTFHGKIPNFSMTSGIWKYLPSIKYGAENKINFSIIIIIINIYLNFNKKKDIQLIIIIPAQSVTLVIILSSSSSLFHASRRLAIARSIYYFFRFRKIYLLTSCLKYWKHIFQIFCFIKMSFESFKGKTTHNKVKLCYFLIHEFAWPCD